MNKIDITNKEGKVEYITIGPRPVLILKVNEPITQEKMRAFNNLHESITEYLVIVSELDIDGKIIASELLHS